LLPDDGVQISVVLPVGPFPADQTYLGECIRSLACQTRTPAALIVVDDMAGVEADFLTVASWPIRDVRVHRNVWRLGCADSWNVGVALAPTEYVLLMGADDTLDSAGIAAAVDTIERSDDPLAWYWYAVKYSTGEEQDAPCNAAVVSKTLWRHVGGFPPEAGVGAPDALLISAMIGAKGRAGNLRRIAGGAHYWHRVHEGQDTRRTGKYWPEIISIRDKFTESWNPPAWSRTP
jgi:glycosyltransferase involved in cell wall biosynthesis